MPVVVLNRTFTMVTIRTTAVCKCVELEGINAKYDDLGASSSESG